jgi:proteasome lid subunit RPN8/RPN11
MQKYRVLKSQLHKIIREAIEAAKENGSEICGLLVDNGYFIEIIQTRNRIKRGGGYAFYTNEVKSIHAAAKKLGHQIVGTFHSHPLYIASPSESDIENAVDDSIMLIIDVLDKKTGLWHIKNLKKRELGLTLIK